MRAFSAGEREGLPLAERAFSAGGREGLPLEKRADGNEMRVAK